MKKKSAFSWHITMRFLSSILIAAILCKTITPIFSPVSVFAEEIGEKFYYKLNSNIMERNSILLYEYDGTIYIVMEDLCSLTRSKSQLEGQVFTVTHGILNTTFDYEQQQFSDGWQTVETKLINTDSYYLVPAIEFLSYFGANVDIDRTNETLYCFMPDCTPWEAMNVDYENTLVDIYELYGGKENVELSLTLDILLDFFLNGTPNGDEYLIDAYNSALSINLSDFDSIQQYQKTRDEEIYNYLTSDEGQTAANYVSNALNQSISGVEYLCASYYNTIELKFADLVKNSYNAGHLDESTHYAEQILNAYRKKNTILNVAEKSKIPLAQVAPVIIQTALESAQQLKYTASTNNLVYRVMGDENINYLGLDVQDNNWFRIANTYKNTSTAVSNTFLENAKSSFSDMGWDQLIGDCVQSFTGTSQLLFAFSKECATTFAKWFPLTSSTIEASESDRQALYLSELQQNVAYVISNIDFSKNYKDGTLYQKYIEAALLYCRVSISMYQNLITMVNKFGNDRDYWTALFQNRIDSLAVSMYKLTLFQDDGASECIPLDLATFKVSSTEEASIFESMPSTFAFSSGAGGWATQFALEDDGSFTGQYYDSDMGDIGTEYPKGTVYISKFTGKFTTPTQINDYTYSMQLENLQTEGTTGEEYYENGQRFIYSDPYGFDNADEFLIYTPGAPMTELPEGFKNWLIAFMNPNEEQTLPCYGIYNVGGEEGFVGFEDTQENKKNEPASQQLDNNSIREQIINHYTELWQPKGTYTCSESEDIDNGNEVIFVLRYAMSDEEAQERIANGGMVSANTLVTTIVVNKETGEAYDNDGLAEAWTIEK